jgi:hypothetical protein
MSQEKANLDGQVNQLQKIILIKKDLHPSTPGLKI